jgi:hypothetical protein
MRTRQDTEGGPLGMRSREVVEVRDEAEILATLDELIRSGLGRNRWLSQPGDGVRIKTRDEIVPTLDTTTRNRGMTFDAEMFKYRGREAKVLRRVEQIIDEGSGQDAALQQPVHRHRGSCLHRGLPSCLPRASYSYWREIWLEKVR